ncbi:MULTISPECIES: helix-turn-helix transcriptional regulator [unclassified Parabacteroides]|uniref:helix-turn-helix transcriptional regulator n=1 Tax=unclassified Parabacteroides TaxID=2649774 RepID=UPI0024748FB5|nr:MULTISPECIES: helix-turn-helix transcriptional regulator [unclassified Parabacteroides]
MQMSGVVEEYPSLIPVINRFGIRLGLGDQSVQELCGTYSLDTDFFLTVINTFLNEEYFPEKKLQSFHTSQIIDYLQKTNHFYRQNQLPNIERHLSYFIKGSTGNQSLSLIGDFFAKFKKEFESRIEYDEKTWFPYCLALNDKLQNAAQTVSPPSPLQKEDSIEEMLADLKKIMVKHLSGQYDENLCYAVIVAINNLQKDIKQQNRIRYRILAPMVNAMENTANK